MKAIELAKKLLETPDAEVYISYYNGGNDVLGEPKLNTVGKLHAEANEGDIILDAYEYF